MINDNNNNYYYYNQSINQNKFIEHHESEANQRHEMAATIVSYRCWRRRLEASTSTSL